jgi:hypothetical protein
VESIDIFPTIAESLGIELPESVDGISVSQDRRRPRKTLYFERGMTVIEPDLPQRRAAVMRQFELFGHDDLGHLPSSIATHPEWNGRKISSFVVKGEPVPATLLAPLGERTPDPLVSWMNGRATSQSFVKGKFAGSERPEGPAELIVAVDGLVRDSGMTFPSDRNEQCFEFLLAESAIRSAAQSVRIYLVDRSQNPPTLRPVSTSLANQF